MKRLHFIDIFTLPIASSFHDAEIHSNEEKFATMVRQLSESSARFVNISLTRSEVAKLKLKAIHNEALNARHARAS